MKKLIKLIKNKATGFILAAILTIVVILKLVDYVLQGYSVTWTGFTEKSLWDWLDLLIIPFSIALVGAIFGLIQFLSEQKTTKQRYLNDQQIASNNLRESILQAYFDKMTDLLLNGASYMKDAQSNMKNNPDLDARLRAFTRARTLTVLRALDKDKERKGFLLRFLYESELLFGNFPDISLEKADLSDALLSEADLTGANLSSSNLSRADLSKAYLVNTNLDSSDLSEANLAEAYLREAQLNEAVLRGACLVGANMYKASLIGADLTNANLKDADFTEADLSEANVSVKQLKEALSIKGVILSDEHQR